MGIVFQSLVSFGLLMQMVNTILKLNKVIIIFHRNLAEVVGGFEAVVEGVIQEVKRFHLTLLAC